MVGIKYDVPGIKADSSDSSFVDTLSQEAQEAEEQFDLSLVTSLEVDVVPHLGDQHIPDHLIVQLGRTLQIASRIHDLDVSRMPYGESSIPTPPLEGPSLRAQMARSTSFDAGDASAIYGTTNTGILLPRERMSYWCFDLLFHVCSDSAKGMFYLFFNGKADSYFPFTSKNTLEIVVDWRP